MNFLEKLLDSIPKFQKSAVKSLISQKRKTGQIVSIRQVNEEADKLFRSVRGKLGSVLMEPIIAIVNEKISSESHNKNMQDIYLDLNTLYSHIDKLGKLEQSQAVILDSEYAKARAAVQKLLNDVRVFSLRKKFPDFNEVKVIDFNTARNWSVRTPKAYLNDKTRLLELIPITSSRLHLTNRTTRETKIYTKTYASGIQGSLSGFGPEKMVDQRTDTFWGHLVMSDAPIFQRFERTTSSGSSYQVDTSGPIVEVYFQFSHGEQFNTIRLLPFSEFPVKIIDIGYRPSSNSQVFYPIENFEEESTLDWVEYNFEKVIAYEVRITIAQETYKKILYHLPKRLLTGTDLFQKIFEVRTKKIINGFVPDSDLHLSLLKSVDSYTQALQALNSISKLSPIDSVSQTPVEYTEDYISIVNSIYSELDPLISTSVIQQYFNSNAIQDGDTTVEINKYEYLLGLREVEITYERYSSVGFYESEKFSLNATPSEVTIEVDDRHIEYKTSWQDDYRKSSVEWDIDIGDGRRLPIHPRNIIDSNGLPTVKDELLEIDRNTRIGYSRLGSYYASPLRLKKDGQVIPQENYTYSKDPNVYIPKLKLELSGEWYDENSLYTIDYTVSPESYKLDILGNFRSRRVPSPELFQSTSTDNDIQLSKFPYINYEVINLPGIFQKDSYESKWTFIPEQENVFTGQVKIWPNITDEFGNILQTGNVTGYCVPGLWGDRDGQSPLNWGTSPALHVKYFSPISGVDFGYYLQIMNSRDYVRVSSFNSSITGFVTDTPFSVTSGQISSWLSESDGLAFSGNLTGNISGYLNVDYVLGIGVDTDDVVFTLGNSEYSPLTIKVGGRLAKNITDYVKLEHPSFSVSSNRGTEYEYIQAGNKLYFNQPISSSEISVEYDWIAEYLRIYGTLRCNKLINPDSTPKIDEIRVLINNMII